MLNKKLFSISEELYLISSFIYIKEYIEVQRLRVVMTLGFIEGMRMFSYYAKNCSYVLEQLMQGHFFTISEFELSFC